MCIALCVHHPVKLCFLEASCPPTMGQSMIFSLQKPHTELPTPVLPEHHQPPWPEVPLLQLGLAEPGEPWAVLGGAAGDPGSPCSCQLT